MFHSPKAFETLIYENVTDIVFFIVCNYIYFEKSFIEELDSKGILNTLRKGTTSAMKCADLAAFTFVTWQMRSLTL